MFTLVTDRSKFFRVKRGQSEREIEKTFCVPLSGVFDGAILGVEGSYTAYAAQPGDSYKKIAERFGLEEGELRKINLDRPVYPSRKLYIPCKRGTPKDA